MSATPLPAIRRVGLIGYGYVGRGTGHAFRSFAEVGWHDPTVEGSRPLAELARWADALFICVPTPMTSSGKAELSIVYEVVHQLAGLRMKVTTVVKSTIPPGTTDALARRWPAVPLAFSPEFLRERHFLEDAVSPHRIILGWSPAIDTPRRAQLRELLLRSFPQAPLIELPSLEAELIKYAANALFGVKVSFANEMAELAERLGASWEAIRAPLVLDPRIGDGHLAVPGPDGERGFGGKCLPKDMAALLNVAAEHGLELEVIAAALRANGRRRGEQSP